MSATSTTSAAPRALPKKKRDDQVRTAEDGADGVHVPTAIGNKPSRVRKPSRKGLRMRIGNDGSYEVHHLASDAAAPEFGESVALTDAANLKDASPVWIQVAKVGQFAGHPAGAFRLDEKVFGEIVYNFRATQNKRIPIDFEHASEAEATAGSIPVDGAPAQGWIVDLDNRGPGGLWALVEWGDKAREYIRSGAYRYISPAVRFNSKDRVTGQTVGARLTSAGLTNQPFLDGMQPLAAKDKPMLNTPMMKAGDFMPALRTALRLPELATHAECADQLGRLRTMCQMAEKAGASPMGIHEGVDLGGYISPLRSLMSMPSHAKLHELLDAVEEMIEAAMERHEIEHHAGEHDDEDEEGPESGPLSSTMSAMADRQETAAMADDKITTNKDTDALAVALKDEQAKREAAEARAAEASLKMRDLEATVAALKANDEARAKADAERKAAEEEARVTETIAVYSDKKGISEADRPDLLVMLRANKESFDRLYPRVPAAQMHLLRNLTASKVTASVQMSSKRPDVPGHVAPAAASQTSEGVMRGRTAQALARGLSLEDAILMSSRAPTNHAAS